MQNKSIRTTSALLLAVLFLAVVMICKPTVANARNYGVYSDVATVYDQGSCPSMQGMSVHGNYVYACKINGDTETSAVVARVNKDTGSTSYLVNSSTGSMYFTDFGHGNDIEVETIGGVTTLFVPTSKSGSGSLVRYAINGTSATKVGSYTMTYNGSNIGGGAIRVMHYDNENITFLFKSGDTCFTGTLPINQTSGTLAMSYLCKLDYSSCYVNGIYKDTSNYSLQGMGYHDFKLYLPLSGHTVSGHENISIILVYDLEGASGTIKPDPDLTFCITSSYYGALFEVESCEISPKDNRMYFSANRRITNSNTNHDGVSYISNWSYDPSSRNTEVRNYRWEVINDRLVSVTTGGSVYNGAEMLEGSISDGAITNGRYVLSKTVVLEHDAPWIVEWKAAGCSGAPLLFATQAVSAYTDAPYIFCDNKNSIITIGASNGSQYNNYGIRLSDYGIDGTALHTYRLTNKIASDGTNMVYLSVDGVELGTMNHHFIAGTSQGTTSDWVCGKDFKFSYLGTANHKITGYDLEYIQVWGNGIYSTHDEPNTYRWESKDNALTSMTCLGLTQNAATSTAGTVSGNAYSGCRYELNEPIVLSHSQPWVVEWKTEGVWTGGALMLAADHMSNTKDAPYLFRNSNVIVLGRYTGSTHEQWGVCPADHGIDITAPHVYAIKNRVNDDGSNMVYLYVDGVEIAPMNTYCRNGGKTTTISDAISGMDFVFGYMGTYQHSISATLDYLQVWESGIPAENANEEYRWETQNDQLINVVSDTCDKNTTYQLSGSCTDGIFTSSQYFLEESVMLLHDRPWSIEWKCAGNWNGGALLFSSSMNSSPLNNTYLFRSHVIGFGYSDGSKYNHYGINPNDFNIIKTEPHVYRLTNRISEDGSNMVYLIVDGVELGALNNHYVNGITIADSTSDWISGKDFSFSYIGTILHPVNDTTLEYLHVFENCSHVFTEWETVNAVTCESDGTQQRTCPECGEVQTRAVESQGHSYVAESVAVSCQNHPYTHYTCSACGDQYDVYAEELYSDWSEAYPDGIDAALVQTKTQYRDSDFESLKSTESTLNGYTLSGSEWIPGSTNKVEYVTDWGGFSASSSLYTQYNKQSSKVSASETETKKITISNDSLTGYLYYHWCYGNSYYSVEAKSGSYTTFHAYYSTTAPSNYNVDESDWSYQTAHSCCSNSEWFFVTEVYTQTYVTYNKVYTHTRWTDWSDWGDDVLEASDTCKVETRKVYRYVNAPLGDHSYTSTTTAPTCTQLGCTTYTCTKCGDSYTTDEVAPTGHNYEKGICTVCGADDLDYVELPTVTAKSFSLSFESEILVNFYYTISDMTQIAEHGMLVFSSNPGIADYATANEIYSEPVYNERNGRYMATTEGIAAKEMGDTRYYAAYAKLTDGTYLYSEIYDYSPKKYAVNMLSKSTTSEAQKALCVAMLNYGAAAQGYFGYNTDDLMNAVLTAEQQSMVAAYDSTLFTGVVPADSSKTGIFAKTETGFSKRSASVSFDGAFAINYYFTPNSSVDSEITFYYWSAADYNAVSMPTPANATGTVTMMEAGDGSYWAQITGIAAKELDDTYYVAANYTSVDQMCCSGLVAYSLSKYCMNNDSGDMGSLAQATAMYGYYAKLYFAS